MLKKLSHSRSFYIIREMVRRYFADGVSKSAAELAYFMLFSFFPLVMFLSSVIAMLPIPEDVLNLLTRIMPEDVRNIIQAYLEYLSTVPSLSPLIIGGGLTLYFLTRSVSSLMRTMGRIYHPPLRSHGIYQTLMAFILTAGFLISVVLSFVLLIVGNVVLRLLLNVLPLQEVPTQLLHLARYGITIGFLFFFLLLLNYVVPGRGIRLRDAVPGALFSLVSWLVFSAFFSFYIDNMSRYSVLYGSLGAMMVLMLWLYLTGIILLMGAQLNHILLQLDSRKLV